VTEQLATGSFTMADVTAAVEVLKAATIPPCVCVKCGSGFYVINPPMIFTEGFRLVGALPTLCNRCDPDYPFGCIHLEE